MCNSQATVELLNPITFRFPIPILNSNNAILPTPILQIQISHSFLLFLRPLPFPRLFFYALYRLLVQKILSSSLNLLTARLEREMFKMIQVSFAWQTWWHIFGAGWIVERKKFWSKKPVCCRPVFFFLGTWAHHQDWQTPPSLPSKRNLDHLVHLPFKTCSR